MKRRTRVVETTLDITSSLMLATARLRWVEEKRWDKKC